MSDAYRSISGFCFLVGSAFVRLIPLVWVVAEFAMPVEAGSAPGRSSLSPTSISPARTRYVCPHQIEPLTTALLRDLPGYINRVSLRTLPPQLRGKSYAVIASRPEFEPLPIGSSEVALQDQTLQQVFFTVLERQYVDQQVNQLQHYHWLFLAKTSTGWQVALMFSRLGPYPSHLQPPTPPRESSRSITAQAVQSWLNNCQAGVIKL